jgi:chemotaxis protein MotB
MIKPKFSGRSIGLLALLVIALGMVGCNDKLKAENEALWTQNQELQGRLNAAQQELAAVQAERNALLEQVTQLENELAAARMDEPVAASNTGFEQVEGVEITRGAHGEVAVRVPGDVLFASGKITLKSSAKRTLSQIADVLKSRYSNQQIRVEGYTDSDPIRKSPWKTNLRLSAERAMAVHDYLESQGISEDRMYVAGFGATNFVAPNTTAAGKAKNRRVEIVVVQ